MRIAYVCADRGVPVFGRKGCSIHVQEVVRALAAQGVQVDLFATRCDGERPSGLSRIALHRLPMPSTAEPEARERESLAANRNLRVALKGAGPFDLIYERYSLWSFAGMEYARDRGVPGLLEVNAPLIEEQAEYRILVNRADAERVAERVFAAATAVIAVSEEIALYLARYPGAREHVHIVPNGVDPDRFPTGLRPSHPGRPGTFTVGFAGTLKPWHGVPILIEAFDTLRGNAADTRLLIVGDGPERASLVTDVAARGLSETVQFTGAVDPREVPGLLASMDVAVAPYPELSNFYFSPLKVYEYMAAGLPVAVSRCGELSRLIQDGANGLLCPPGDPMALAAALDRLRREPELRAALGRAARATVLQHHTWASVVRRILCLAGRLQAKPAAAAAQRATERSAIS